MGQNPSRFLSLFSHEHTQEDEVLHDIPHDVVLDILTRLPSKSLIRFRCVCKTWFDSIMDSSFIPKHIRNLNKFHNYTKQKSKGNLIDRSRPPHNQMSLRDGDILVKHKLLKLPFIIFRIHDINDIKIKIFGSCNGLICFKHPYFENLGQKSHDIYLWNPSIRKLKALPLPHIHPCYTFNVMRAELGIGFDCRTKDFKVVRFLYLQDNYKDNINVSCHEVEVYSLSTNSWKRITTIVQCYTNQYQPPAFVNGAIHWVAKKKGVTGDLIMSFDFADEVFREIWPPNPYIGELKEVIYIAEFQKSLSILSCHYNTIDWSMYKCCVWVMKEYGMTESWTKLFTIDSRFSNCVPRPLGITMNGEVLLEIERDGLQLASYDPETQQINDLGILVWDAVPYVESLALLKEGRKQFFGKQSLWEKLGTWGNIWSRLWK